MLMSEGQPGEGGDRKRVLYTSTSYLPAIGGAQSHAHQLARHLRTDFAFQVVAQWHEHRTDWLLGSTLRAPSEQLDYTLDGIPVTRLGLSAGQKWAMTPAVGLYFLAQGAAIERLASVLEPVLAAGATEVDLVHNGRVGREPFSFASLRLARRRGVPFVLTPFHHPRWGGWLHRHFAGLYRQADALIALTEAEKGLLAGLGVLPDRIHLAGMAPILAAQAQPAAWRQAVGASGPLILFLGQHFDYKGYRQLLRAAPLVWRKAPEAEFVFAGPAIGRSESAFEGQADPRIHRLGAIDLQTKTDALAACAMLCVPSTQESFGGVYTEAWALGKPVIGCPIPSVAEVVNDGVNGLLVPQSPRALADAILQLLGDPAAAERMGAAGKQKVVEKYNWPHIAAKVKQVYDLVLG